MARRKVSLTARQRALAERIVAVGEQEGATPKKIKSAIETGLVETGLRNLPGGDADSAGWRQERASLYHDPTNVEAAAHRFFHEAAAADRPGLSAGDLAARVQRPREDLRGRYQQVSSDADAVLAALGRHGGGAAALDDPSLTRSDVKLGTKTTFDQAGFDQANRRALLAQVIAQRHGEHGVLFRTGLLSTEQPDPGEFTKSALTSQIVSHDVNLGPGTSSASGRVSSRPGPVAFAPAADRPGVKTRPVVRSFLRELAGTVGGVTVGTGTNHNRLTVDGNVSDHWTGHAADLPVPVDSHRGDQIAYHALRLAGVPNRRAAQMAKQGGLFTLHPDSGPLAGHRVQVIWKTNAGGNHHNHVHVGIR